MIADMLGKQLGRNGVLAVAVIHISPQQPEIAAGDVPKLALCAWAPNKEILEAVNHALSPIIGADPANSQTEIVPPGGPN